MSKFRCKLTSRCLFDCHRVLIGDWQYLPNLAYISLVIAFKPVSRIEEKGGWEERADGSLYPYYFFAYPGNP